MTDLKIDANGDLALAPTSDIAKLVSDKLRANMERVFVGQRARVSIEGHVIAVLGNLSVAENRPAMYEVFDHHRYGDVKVTIHGDIARVSCRINLDRPIIGLESTPPVKAACTLLDLASLSLEDEKMRSDVRCSRCGSKIKYDPDPFAEAFSCPEPMYRCGVIWTRYETERDGTPIHHWFYVNLEYDNLQVLEEVDDGRNRYTRSRIATMDEQVVAAEKWRVHRLDKLAQEFRRGW